MKQLGVFLLPLDGMLVHLRVTRALNSLIPIHLGKVRHCESKVSCPGTQHNVPGQGSNLERLIQTPEWSTLTMTPWRLKNEICMSIYLVSVCGGPSTKYQ